MIDNTIKAEWTNADALDLQPTCNQLATAQPETHDKRTETHACDLISRQAAIAFVDCGYLRPPTELAWSDKDVVDMLKRVPSAQPQRMKGRWKLLPGRDDEHIRYLHCSVCHFNGDYESNFCPNCGADMRGE